MSDKKTEALDRIADALEWRNYWEWFRNQPDDGDVTTFGTDGPPVPPKPPKPV